jgi:hypothetical protein
MLRAEGEAQAITTVFNAIHAGQPDQALLAYQYMQMLPSIARGDANKVWIVPSELNDALKGLGSTVSSIASAVPSNAKGDFRAPAKIDVQGEIEQQSAEAEAAAARTVQEAIQAAQEMEKPAALRLDRGAALGSGSRPDGGRALDAPPTERTSERPNGQQGSGAGESPRQSQAQPNPQQ